MTIKEIIAGLNDLKTDAETHREADGTIEDVFQHDIDVLDAAIEVLTSLQTADNGRITMPKIRLKHCPFCGSAAKIRIEAVRGVSQNYIRYSVYCSECKIRKYRDLSSGSSYDAGDAVLDRVAEDWNRRAENETD